MGKAVEVTKKPKHLWLIVFGVLLLVVGAGYKVYAWQTVKADKQRFEEASVLVDKIYTDIVTELGKPEDSKRTNSCSRPYQEFTGYGDPSCDVSISVRYKTKDKDEAEKLMVRTQGLLTNFPNFSLLGVRASSIKERPLVHSVNYAAYDEYKYYGLRCISSYEYITPENNLPEAANSTKAFNIAFSCGGPAKSQHYSIVQ